jgi:hypothetical protein
VHKRGQELVRKFDVKIPVVSHPIRFLVRHGAKQPPRDYQTSRACLVSPKDDEGSQMLLPPYYFNASSFELRLSTIPPFE